MKDMAEYVMACGCKRCGKFGQEVARDSDYFKATSAARGHCLKSNISYDDHFFWLQSVRAHGPFSWLLNAPKSSRDCNHRVVANRVKISVMLVDN
jgi:hypothetical protein